MSTDCTISQHTRTTQTRVFRIAVRDGHSFKALALDTGIPEETLRSYAREAGPAAMPLSAFVKLCAVLPTHLTSLFLEPANKIIATPATGEPDHDTLAGECIDFAAAHAKARHPNGPGGVEIVHTERAVLDHSARRVRAAA